MTPKQAILYGLIVAGVVFFTGAILGIAGSLELRIGFALAMGAMSAGLMVLAKGIKRGGPK